MPMEDKTVEKQRKEFAEKAQTTDNFSALCREYNITRRPVTSGKKDMQTMSQ